MKMPDIKGLRTYTFAIVSLAFLIAGYGMSLDRPAAGIVIFPALATAIVGIVALVAGKSTASALAGGSGIKGALNTLLTSAKPGDPHTPPPTPAPSPTTPPGAGKAS